MCYIPKNVYTVCAHASVGALVECELQKARNERWKDGRCCLTLLSCRPVEKIELKYRFCDDCRKHYDGCDTGTVDAVLNYWAFKNSQGYSSSVSPKLIPAELVFGSRAPPRADDPKHPRRELIALGKELPRQPFETPLAWLQRLDEARTMTIQVAQEWSDNVAHQLRRRETLQEQVVRMQPRISTPMSVYPYVHARALSSISELSESLGSTATVPSQISGASKQVHPETLRKLCGMPSSVSLALSQHQGLKSVPSQNSGASKQVHPETLRKLCGMPPSVSLSLSQHQGLEGGLETDDRSQQGIETSSRSLFSLPVGYEVSPNPQPTLVQPLSRNLTRSRSSLRGSSQAELYALETAIRELIKAEASRETAGLINDGSSPPRDFADQADNISSSLPIVAKKVSARRPAQANTGAFINVFLDEAPLKAEAYETDEPNMTSRFSISDIDPADAAELARAGGDPDETTTGHEDMWGPAAAEEDEEEEGELAVICLAPELITPQPRRNPTPPRFVHEYDGDSAAENYV